MASAAWYDCGFCVVCAEDRKAAARLGRVPLAAVRGPYGSPDAVQRARGLRDALDTRARGHRGPGAARGEVDRP